MLIISFLLCISFLNPIITSEPYDLSDYDYPKPTSETDDIYNIALMGTNDIHGAYFNATIQMPDTTDQYYTSGGLQYLGKYIKIMRNTWQDRFAWFDAGDQFQGGLETKLTKGDLITNFYNTMNLTAATIGNHEWDYGQGYLNARGAAAKTFSYIVANVKRKGTNNYIFMENQIEEKIFNIGKIKLGVVGLTTLETLSSTSGDLSNVTFVGYKDIIINHAESLRNAGADAVLLLVHFGVECPKHEVEDKYVLKMWTSQMTYKPCNEGDELSVVLKSIPEGTVDLVISGHTHEIIHQWIKGYPVIASKNNGKYTNIIYLNFKKEGDKYTLLKDQIQIEGPLPVCEKIFTKTLRCDSMNNEEIKKSGDLVNFKFHDVLMEKEPTLQKVSEDGWKEYEEYVNKIVTTTNDKLYQDFETEQPLGNIYTDFLIRVTGADVSILNPGGFRTEWNTGKITAANIYSMSPFDNTIKSYQIYGHQLKRLLYEIQSGTCSFYPTSGLKQVVGATPNKLIEVQLYDGLKEDEIINDKLYTIATNSFLYLGGDDFEKVMKWYNPLNVKDYGDFTEALINYLMTFTGIEVEKFIDKDNQRLRVKGKNLRAEIY